VTLADTNFWLALTLSGHAFHRPVRDWFDGRPARASVLFCRATQQSLLRLLTTEAVVRPYGIPPLTNAEAWKVYDGLVSDRRVAWAGEADPAAIESRWKNLAAGAAASPKLWMDAYLAAFTLAGGHQLVTTDKAFAQFPGLDAVILAAAQTKA
jgi:uncharacterized protein